MFVCLVRFLTSSSTTRLYRGRAPRQERLTILRAATHETELGDHDFCLSRSHYTDTDPTCRERAATAGIEPGTSSPGVAHSTAELPRPPPPPLDSEIGKILKKQGIFIHFHLNSPSKVFYLDQSGQHLNSFYEFTNTSKGDFCWHQTNRKPFGTF